MAPNTRSRSGRKANMMETEKAKVRVVQEAKAKKATATNTTTTSPTPASSAGAASLSNSSTTASPTTSSKQKRKRECNTIEVAEVTEEEAPIRQVKKAKVNHKVAEKRKRVDQEEEDEEITEVTEDKAPIRQIKKAKVNHKITEKRKRVDEDEEAIKVEKKEPVREFKKMKQATTSKVAAKKDGEEVPEVASARSARATSTSTRRALNKVKARPTSPLFPEYMSDIYGEYTNLPSFEAGSNISVVAHSDGINETVTVISKGFGMVLTMPVRRAVGPSNVSASNEECNASKSAAAGKTGGRGRNQQEQEEKVREKEVKKERKGEQEKKEEIKGRGIIPTSSSSSSSTQLIKTSRPLKPTDFEVVEGDYDTDITLDDSDSEDSDLEDSDSEDSDLELDYDDSTETDSDLATSFTASQSSSSSDLKTTTSNTNNDDDDEDIPTISSALVHREIQEMMRKLPSSKKAHGKKPAQKEYSTYSRQ